MSAPDAEATGAEIIAGSPESITKTSGKEGEAYRQAAIDFGVGFNPLVPDWKDYVLYGAATPQGKATAVGYKKPFVFYGYGNNANNGNPIGSVPGLYRKEGNVAGVRNTPLPGIMKVQVSNKGDMGTIRRASFDIKCYSLEDLQNLEMMYMVPGISVLVEWGWYHPDLYVEPINVDNIQDGSSLTSTKLINEQILKKTLGLEDLYNINSAAPMYGKGGPNSGIYDGMLGIITKFGWTNAGDGSYDCRVDLISPGSLATGISTNTYAMGCNLTVDETLVQITDVRAIMSIIRRETKDKEGASTKKLVDEDAEEMGEFSWSSGGWGDKAEVVEDDQNIFLNKNLTTRKLNTAEYGVSVKVEDGKVVFTPSTKKGSDTSEYFVGDYQAGKAKEHLAIKGDATWWKKILKWAYGIEEFKQGNYDDVRKALVNAYSGNGGKGHWNAGYAICWGSGGEGKQNRDAIANIIVAYSQDLNAGNYYLYESDKTGAGYKVSPFSGVQSYDWNTEGFKSDEYRNPWAMRIKRSTTGKWQYSTTDGETANFGGVSFNKRGHSSGHWLPSCVGGGSKYDHKYSKNAAGKYPPNPAMINPLDGSRHYSAETLKESLKGGEYTMERSSAIKHKWKGNKDDGFTDAAGNPVGARITDAAGEGYTDDTEWGKADEDYFLTKPVTGVTVYKKDAEGKVTVVGSQIGTNRSALMSQINNKVAQFAVDEKDGIDSSNSEYVKTEANIAASMRNGNVLSWWPKGDADKPVKKNVISYANTDTYDHVIMYSTLKPIHAPDYEIGYDIDYRMEEVEVEEEGADGSKVTKKEKQLVPYYPIGCIAYSETYVSWRFIEDYIINEIYMPKSNIDAAETNVHSKSEDLELKFESTTTLTDKDKEGLVDSEYFKERYPNLVERAEEDQGGQTLTDDTLDTVMVKSQEIVNHWALRSFNPNVCILPGQESVPEVDVFDDAKDAKDAIDFRLNADNVKNRYLDERNKFVEPELQRDKDGKRIMRNGFRHINSNGKEVSGIGNLRNMLINADLVGEAAEGADNVRKFAMTILKAVNKACGNPWKFSIINIGGAGQIKIIDQNYTPTADEYKKNAVKVDNLEEGVYKFSGIGSDNICKDVKIQSKIPNELQTMAYYGAMGSSNEKGSETQMFNMYAGGVTDRLKNISKVTIYGESGNEEALKTALTQMLSSYMVLGSKARYEVERGLDKTPSISEGETVAADFVKRFIHGDTIEVPGYRPPIPIDVSVSLNGISGIYMGNAIMVKTVEEGGLLPNRYRGQVALQATSVDHVIDSKGWTTDIGTIMRPLANVENRPTIIGKIQPPLQFDDEPFVTGGATPNADTLRKHFDKLDFVEEKFLEELVGPNGTYKIKNDMKRNPPQGELASAAMWVGKKSKKQEGRRAKPTDITPSIAKIARRIFSDINEILANTKAKRRECKISAGNDYFHWAIYQGKSKVKEMGLSGNYKSRHCKGKGIDFTVKPISKPYKTDPMLARIDDLLDRYLHANTKDGKFPATAKTAQFRFINEYVRRTPAASAPHMHISVGEGDEATDEINIHAKKRFAAKGGTSTYWPYDRPIEYYRVL